MPGLFSPYIFNFGIMCIVWLTLKGGWVEYGVLWGFILKFYEVLWSVLALWFPHQVTTCKVCEKLVCILQLSVKVSYHCKLISILPSEQPNSVQEHLYSHRCFTERFPTSLYLTASLLNRSLTQRAQPLSGREGGTRWRRRLCPLPSPSLPTWRRVTWPGPPPPSPSPPRAVTSGGESTARHWWPSSAHAEADGSPRR